MSNPISDWIQTQLEKAEGKIDIPITDVELLSWDTAKGREQKSRDYIKANYTTATQDRIQVTVHEEEWE